MEERPLREWLDEDVDLETLDAGAAAIETAAEKARQAALAATKRRSCLRKVRRAGNGVLVAPEGSQEPVSVRPVTRPDPILPVVRVHSVNEHSAVEAGRLAFGGLVEGRDDLDAQLPLLPGTDGPRVSLLDLADVRGGPIMARGRGAPLDLRLLVAACIMTPHNSRKSLLQLAVPVRQLRDFCFPNGWERRRHWPALRRAMWKARDFVIPDGRGGWWLPFHLHHDPGPDAALDDLVRFLVTFPEGSAHGPVIDRRELARLGVKSAPRFRAYIAAHSVSWLPGRTRVVSPKAGGRRVWASDPDAYPVLSAEDRRRLAFGAGDKGHRLRADQDAAWEDLPGVEILSRTATTQDGRHGWVIVPEDAAEAVRKRGGRQP